MLQDIIAKILASRKKIGSAPCKTKLRLEVLEDRVVPSYVWNAPNVAADAKFNNPTNWLDTTTGRAATVAPGPFTDCYFNATSPTSCSMSNNQGQCRSITTAPEWSGNIDTNGPGITIWGINGGKSSIKGGAIIVGTVNVMGGTLDYNASNLSVTDLTARGIFVEDGARLTVDKNCTQINTPFSVGNNTNDPISMGKLIFNTVIPELQYSDNFNLPIQVGSHGILTFNPNSELSGANIISTGTVFLLPIPPLHPPQT